MLEPFDTVTVIVPDDLVGSVMSDLSARRARLLGTDKVGDDRTSIVAEVPQTELVRYAVDLRSASHGAGTFTRTFAHYESMPEDVAAQVAARPGAESPEGQPASAHRPRAGTPRGSGRRCRSRTRRRRRTPRPRGRPGRRSSRRG